ncbi:negative elongation factor E-like [Clavelina lepadiformis]|uniref:negative elongation factor E-like n=1 Tax=Clavelina lepadiformis TaxID=159417 RepID=UPI004041948D
MVSTKLTEEEEYLKKQFQTLRNLKKELKQLTLKRKQEQAVAAENGPPSAKQKKAIIQGSTPANQQEFSHSSFNMKTKVIKSWDAAANTEAAKKLLKSGAVKIKLETKTSFKRSSNLKRKLTDSEGQRKPVFQPFNADESTEDDMPDEIKDKKESRPSGFTSPKVNRPHDHNKDNRSRFNRRDKKTERKGPRRGNTLYVHGQGVSEKMIRTHFGKFGNIVNVNIERGKSSAFVSFDTFEAAEQAIDDMDEACIEDCRLKVSLARRQPMLESVKASTPWANMTERGDKGSSTPDMRTPVTYDDDFV